MRLLLLLISTFLFSGCVKLTNQLQSRVLECGESAREGGPWIKVLDPQGQELPKMESLDARALQVDAQGQLPPALKVSQKHCVQVGESPRVVIRSMAQDRSWSAVVAAEDGRLPNTVRLEDNSQSRVSLRCPDPWILNGRFKLPLDINTPTLDAWVFAPRLISADGRESPRNFSLGDSAQLLVWPEDWADGPGRIFLRQKNLLQSPRSALAELEESCPLIIDRQKPKLVLTPAPDDARELVMQPGALLRVKIEDSHPAALRTCLQPLGQNHCEKPEAWQTLVGEVSLPMPDQGRWMLLAEAQDAAGNSAEPLQQVVDIVRRDLLQSISTRVDQALAEKGEKAWDALQSLMKALVDYKRLSIDKEKNQIRSKLVDGVLGIAPYLQEYQRATLNKSGRRAWAVDDNPSSPWIVLTDDTLSLWSSAGHLLRTLPVPLVRASDWSVTQKTLALGGDDELWVLRIQDDNFSEPMTMRWMDHKDIKGAPSSLLWVPGKNQMLVTFPDSEPAIVEQGREGLTVSQRLDALDSSRTAVAPDGLKIAAVDGDSVLKIWKFTSGGWTLEDQSGLAVAGFAFAAGEEKRLIVLLRDGRLISWSPGVLWKGLDQDEPGERPSEPSLGAVQHVQAWSDGRTGVMERGGRFYQWHADPSKTLQPLQLNGFAWDRLQTWKVDPCQRALWMQDDRSLSYWEWQEGSTSAFQKIGEWQLGTQDTSEFAVRCDGDQRKFLTMTGAVVRFWAQRTPLVQIRGDQTQVVLSRFESGRDDGEALFTAGFDGVIRVWSRAGQKLQEWIGHRAQINELLYLPEWKLFASSAEDSSSRLWKPNGALDQTLSLGDIPGAIWRDAALAFDSQHLLTVGRGVLAFWALNMNRTELTITIPLESGERPGFDSLVRLPGPPRILVRLMKGHVGRALVVQPDGALVTEPGLPPLQKFRWIEWVRDGSRIAFSDAQQRVRIYRHESGGWQEELVLDMPGTDTNNTPVSGLTRFAFAPDGTRFAALRGGRNLIIGKRDDDRWSIVQVIPLASAVLDRGLQWSLDSSRLVTIQSGQAFVRDMDGVLLHQFQSFPGSPAVSSLGLGQDPDLLALGSGPWVRLIDLNLDRLQTQLCTWLDAWIKGPDAPPEFLQLCTK